LYVLGLCLAVTACGPTPGPKVTGSVNLDGKPLTQARVVFIAKEKGVGTTGQAVTDANGNFEVLPDPRDGRTLTPGNYAVLITKMVDKKGNMPSEEDAGQLQAAGLLRNAVPNRYGSEEETQLKAEIKSGENKLPPFELKGK